MKKFSLKLLLKCILFSILVTTFIGSTLIFLENVNMNAAVTSWNELESNPTFIEEIKEQSKDKNSLYNEFEFIVNEAKEKYGEDYPAEEVAISKLMTFSNTQDTIYIYIVSIIIGILLGNIAYFVIEQKATGKVLVIELLLSIVSIGVLLFLMDGIYNLIINSMIKSAGYNLSFKDNVFNENGKVIILSETAIIVFVVYVVNYICQKIRSQKLNKELNK